MSPLTSAFCPAHLLLNQSTVHVKDHESSEVENETTSHSWSAGLVCAVNRFGGCLVALGHTSLFICKLDLRKVMYTIIMLTS